MNDETYQLEWVPVIRNEVAMHLDAEVCLDVFAELFDEAFIQDVLEVVLQLGIAFACDSFHDMGEGITGHGRIILVHLRQEHLQAPSTT